MSIVAMKTPVTLDCFRDNPDSKTKALPYVAAMMGRYGTIPRKVNNEISQL